MALAELRSLVRGIHPPVLADRGLADAIKALALDAPVRIHIASELPGRRAAPVESAAFFAVSELLANVAKHACARQAWIDIRYTGGMLRIGVGGAGGGIGYLLKDRVLDSAQFVSAIRRVAAGGTAMDPEVISRLMASKAGEGAVAALSPREREVLALMAEGRSNAAIAQRMVITERAVAKHTASIFLKLDLQPSDDDNRRVLAVLAHLGR
jgi:DNA-binding CsgD family transcriptional regulator